MTGRHMEKNRKKKGIVELSALNTQGDVVEELELTLEEYYEGAHRIVDEDAYRAARGITTIRGRVFNPQGAIDQEFCNKYLTSGAYAGGRTVYADGTVNED